MDAPPVGSCIPIKEDLIPSIRELSHPKRGIIPLMVDLNNLFTAL